MRIRHKIVVVVLVGVCYLLLFYKIHIWGSGISRMLPQRYYELMLNMSLDGHDEDVQLSVALPTITSRQTVREEFFGSPEFAFHIRRDGSNRWGIWEKSGAHGRYVIVYSGMVRAEAKRYELAARIDLPKQAPAEVESYLLATKDIQSDSPDVKELFDHLAPLSERGNAAAIVRAAFDYTSKVVKPIEFKGTTDAVTTLRLGEASCGGKSRLFAALCRAGGIPARLVGGLIMKDGTWRSSHIWAETWIAGRWIPFCPLNGYFAEIPSHYLVLYYGDFPLFTYTRDINFNYYFHAKRVLAPPPEAIKAAKQFPRGILNLWLAFEQVQIPLNLLKIILMMPLGALVVVLARNIIGIETFGTFMPALMAVAFRDTGLVWGLVLFISILAFVATIRYGLERLQLLHTPRLAVLMTGTVAFMITVILTGVATGHILPTRVISFPIVILTLTVERFTDVWEEDGLIKAIKVVVGTVFVVAAAFAAMNWELLQIIVVTFPETLLLLVAAFVIVGRWTGIRLSEYLRFRDLIFSKER
jgi:hypothetical protein